MKFYIEGFDNLIKVLEKENFPEGEIERIKNARSYNSTELFVGYATANIQIDVIERYITSDVCVVGYICEIRGYFDDPLI